MPRASAQIGAFFCFTVFAAVCWSTTVPAKDQENAFDIPSTKTAVSKLHQPLASATADSKDPSSNANMTEAPDPATPF